MKVFLDNIPMGVVPGPCRKAGEFFPRLVGLVVRGTGTPGEINWIDVEPLYIPLLRLQRRAGQVLVEINGDRPLVYITLQLRKPFLHVFCFPWRLWDQCEP
jgi:hypothetical protein